VFDGFVYFHLVGCKYMARYFPQKIKLADKNYTLICWEVKVRSKSIVYKKPLFHEVIGVIGIYNSKYVSRFGKIGTIVRSLVENRGGNISRAI
jgi:hypothetical protein